MTAPNALAVFTVTLLFAGERCLLLHRHTQRHRFPDLWTGLGGRVEPTELADLASAARRELAEETGMPLHDVPSLVLRRVLLQHRPASAELELLLYFTGELASPLTISASREGTLHWVAPTDLPALPLVDNARLVLPHLVADRARDPAASEPVKLGIARCDEQGRVVAIAWA
ncbi:MAG: NUDIX domain-containing protein [Thermomicrobium sp.]|jgi:8-oxo-dGTP diphosphatase|nr:NUDIX domain-containing protein [Thermomicrobium sp.]